MKNTLFFGDDFAPVLLKNEEADNDLMRNAIFLNFRTSAATNQKLQITVRTIAYFIDLTPDTAYDYQLAGLYWATGGTTSLRIVNDDGASEYTYITFPELISTDAALQEVEGGENEYYLQGKENPELELISQTIKYTNGRDYYITQMQRIVEFVFGSKNANATALLTCTICLTASGIDTEADVTVRIRVNRTFDDVFVPVQMIKNGKHVITICYAVSGIAQNNRNQVDIYIETSDGELEILQGKVLATLTASGVASSSEFTGLIEVLEYAEEIPAETLITVETAVEELEVLLAGPADATIEDTVQTLQIVELLLTDAFTDAVRLVNYEDEAVRVLEDDDTTRETEDGDVRTTEREQS